MQSLIQNNTENSIYYKGTGQVLGMCCQYRNKASEINRLLVAVCLRLYIPFFAPLCAALIFLRVSSDTFLVTRFAIT